MPKKNKKELPNCVQYTKDVLEPEFDKLKKSLDNSPHIYFDLNMNKDVETFRELVEGMASLYEKKNKNYGNSFTKLYEDLGPIAGLVPLHNKLDRATNLVKGGKNDFESLEDTFIDLANYAIMNVIELRKKEGK